MLTLLILCLRCRLYADDIFMACIKNVNLNFRIEELRARRDIDDDDTDDELSIFSASTVADFESPFLYS